MLQKVESNFFEDCTLHVARQLIGKLLVRELENGKAIVGKIVETEAYTEDDPACHAYANAQRKKMGQPLTGRSEILFGDPGISYVYLNYGIHCLFNVVTEPKGQAGAVLIRAVEILDGVDLASQNRTNVSKIEDLANGPGKLTRALQIDLSHNGLALGKAGLWIGEDKKIGTAPILSSPRVGISKAVERPWRFFESNSPFVSKTKFAINSIV